MGVTSLFLPRPVHLHAGRQPHHEPATPPKGPGSKGEQNYKETADVDANDWARTLYTAATAPPPGHGAAACQPVQTFAAPPPRPQPWHRRWNSEKTSIIALPRSWHARMGIIQTGRRFPRQWRWWLLTRALLGRFGWHGSIERLRPDTWRRPWSPTGRSETSSDLWWGTIEMLCSVILSGPLDLGFVALRLRATYARENMEWQKLALLQFSMSPGQAHRIWIWRVSIQVTVRLDHHSFM